MTGPATTTIVERPPPGPARGPLAAPLWFVVLSSAALLLVAGVALMRAWKRRRR